MSAAIVETTAGKVSGIAADRVCAVLGIPENDLGVRRALPRRGGPHPSYARAWTHAASSSAAQARSDARQPKTF
jgi:hypothetical protein